MTLLASFVAHRTINKDVHNTINDMLILWAAAQEKALLLTEDSLHARFAATTYGARLRELSSVLRLDFATDNRARPKSRESKGYINRGWRICQMGAGR